jgi:Skp family chaperone for outer membrane proteins
MFDRKSIIEMTIKQAEEFTPWINRVLLAIVAFFLLQTNNKFNDLIEKIDTIVVNQAVYNKRIERLEDELLRHQTELDKQEAKIDELTRKLYFKTPNNEIKNH